MKRFVAVLAGLLTLPAFAQDAIVYKEDGVRSDVAVRGSDTPVSATAAGRASARSGGASRGAISRVVPAATSADTATRNVASGRVVAAGRAGVASSSVSARKTASRDGAVVSRTTAGQMGAGLAVAARVAAPTASRVRARATTATGGGVISVNNSTENTAPVPATPASVTSAMESTAALTDFCKAQYTSCMDNFCNVLDDKQGRCSCSKNIKNYEKTETALKQATASLQDVAQQIQYIGLGRDEIETLFAQTEAELVMSATSDNSQIKNDLDKIKNLLVDVKPGTASSTEIDAGISMDLSGLMNFNISSAGFDLGALFGTQTANTNSISNQRGEQLYKTAAARCKAAVLNDCASQGVDISVVSNSYDLEIDKQCVAYERSLTDANDEMVQTVRNAKSVLQRARLMVAQQKNAYDLRGCVNALDSCMQDDFVCGNDYENCLDPYGKYIVDGEVVVGSMPGMTVSGDSVSSVSGIGELYTTWNYSGKNAWLGDGSLSDYVQETLSPTVVTSGSDIMSEYLQHKIGYIQDGRTYGMCASVLNKCQDYTFQNGEYKPNNRVVEEYLMRTLVKIKKSQDSILADYAASCIADVTSCLNENNYDVSSTTKANIAINACRAQIITCMSVNGDSSAEPNPTAMKSWVASAIAGDKYVAAGATKITGVSNQRTCNDGYSGTWLEGACYCVPGYALGNRSACTIKGIEQDACTGEGMMFVTAVCTCENREAYIDGECVANWY